MATTHDSNQNSPAITSDASAVSWSAVFAGAAASAVLSLILLILGIGLGLSAVSPWAQSGVSAMTFGISTIIWLGCTQLIASAMGGYLAGRLRTRWDGVHLDEVYFRDTAHGFLAWAVASLMTAVLLTSAITSIVGGGVSVTASAAGGAVETAMTAVVSDGAASSNVVNAINAAESAVKEAGANDATQAANAATKAVADKARKASATAALWLFVSLLIGAFSASFAAIYGGRQRDL